MKNITVIRLTAQNRPTVRTCVDKCPWGCVSVQDASSPEDILSALFEGPDKYDAIVVEIGDDRSPEFIKRLVKVAPEVPVIAITGKLSRLEVAQLLSCGVAEIIFRCHITPGHVCRVIYAAASIRRANKEKVAT